MIHYLLKISLQDIQPQIWRRFVVPAAITLDRLHEIIQIVMGWQNSHLYEFEHAQQSYSDCSDQDDEWFNTNHTNIHNTFLNDLVKQGETIQYLYDFGDSWYHDIVVENDNYDISKYCPPNFLTAFCLEGKNACPPEDIGGVEGYFEFCQIMENPLDPDFQEVASLFGYNKRRKFNRKKFEIGFVNSLLPLYMLWSRDRQSNWKEIKKRST